MSRHERWLRRSGEVRAAASDNRDALQGADAVVLALRFGVLQGVIEEIPLASSELRVC